MKEDNSFRLNNAKIFQFCFKFFVGDYEFVIPFCIYFLIIEMSIKYYFKLNLTYYTPTLFLVSYHLRCTIRMSIQTVTANNDNALFRHSGFISEIVFRNIIMIVLRTLQ